MGVRAQIIQIARLVEMDSGDCMKMGYKSINQVRFQVAITRRVEQPR